jgi:hypothetical protein
MMTYMPAVAMEEIPVELEDVGPRIYTVTVLSGDPYAPKDKPEDRLRTRCWGYYFNRADAERAIEHNETDISELNYYQYGLLSSLGEGMMAIPDQLQWYRFVWNYDVPPRAHDGVLIPEYMGAEKIDKPSIYDNILFGGL